MQRHLKVVLVLGLIIPACDAFVCSQQRKKAMEISNEGVTAFKNSLYDRAERELKLAIQTDPTYALAHYNLGKVYQKQRKWDKAQESFEAAAEGDPQNANYQYDLGEAFLEMKRLDKARDALKKSTDLNDKDYRAHWRLGIVYKLLEEPKLADAAYRAAIASNPRFDKSFRDLGYLYLEYEYTKEAEGVFGECARINKFAAECFNGQGLAQKDLHEYADATSAFKKSIELEPTLFEAVYNIGMTYADWFEQSHSEEHKAMAKDFLQKFVASGGAKDGGVGYLKAANDKLYALSGT